MPPPGDDELVGRARSGDEDAFTELVRKFQRRVYRAAYHMLGNHSDADDLTQEAFLRAYRGLAGFDRRADFGTWVYRIVVNAALNLLRARKRQRERAPAAPPAAAGSDPVESRELVAAVVGALGALSPTLRVTLILATLEDKSYREIAAALEIPEGTVAWRVNQARKLMRQRLRAALPGYQKGSVDDVLRRTKEALGAP